MANGKKILIVEDDAALRQSLADALEKSGYAVTQARDGDVGQYLSLLSSYDLLISDIHMPEVDGITMTKFVKSRLPVPVILITGLELKDLNESIQDSKAELLLMKPFSTEELLNAVRKILH